MTMKNVSIKSKFLMLMALFGVFTISIAIYATQQMQSVGRGYSAFNAHETTAALYVSRSSRMAQGIRGAIANLMIARSDAEIRRYTAEIDKTRKTYDAYMRKAADAAGPAGADIDAARRQGLAVFDGACADAVKQASSVRSDAAVLASQTFYLKACAPQFPALSDKLHDLVEDMVTKTDKGGADLQTTMTTTVTITYLVVALGLCALSVGGFFAIQAWVANPVIALAALMERLARGDLATEVVGLERKDEIGSMSRAVQVFKEEGMEKLRLAKEAEVQRDRVEAERRDNEAVRAKAAEELAKVVQGLAEGLSTLSSGDLTYRVSTPFAPEYEKLREDFNSAMTELQGTMQTLISRAEAIRAGSGEISQASDDLSRRTEQQAASLEETAAALDEITATVKKSAEGALEARTVVVGARTDAETSSAIVKEAVDAMTEIEQSSQKISQIIGVIDEIAFQTNLLALNAGVEAARAGDAGRGFAVVASEVRALAQRSADAAREIKALISASTNHVVRGVDRVGETGKALSRIVERVVAMNRLVDDIAISAQEQATGLHEVNTAVNQMDQVTQQNAAMVEETTAASHSLREESDALSELIQRFRVGEVRSAAPPQRREAPRPSPARALQQKVAAFAGARAVPPADDNGWEEF